MMRKQKLFFLALVSIIFVLITSCTSPAEQPVTEQPENKGEVVLYGWSGQWDIWWEEWGNKFYEETGIELKYVSGDGDALFARVQAEANDPIADLYLSDTGEGFVFESMGLLGDIDYSKVPNSVGVLPGFLHEMQFAFSTDLALIGYNQDEAPNKPVSWADLAKPEFEGKITINTPTAIRPAYIYMVLSEKYGEEKAWEILLGIFKNAYKWTNSPGDIEGGLATGESAAAVATAGMVMQAHAQNNAVYAVIPEEGPIFDDNTVLLIKNGPNSENAHALINFMLGEYFQDQIMNVYGIGVAVHPTLKLKNEELKMVGLGGNDTSFIQEAAYSVDWKYWMEEVGGQTRIDALIAEIEKRTKDITQ
jgi:ABC-type Fe3+ transport system substrate-binding protein